MVIGWWQPAQTYSPGMPGTDSRSWNCCVTAMIVVSCLQSLPGAVGAHIAAFCFRVGDEVTCEDVPTATAAPASVPRLDERAYPLAAFAGLLGQPLPVRLHRGDHAPRLAVRAHRGGQLPEVAERLGLSHGRSPSRTPQAAASTG